MNTATIDVTQSTDNTDTPVDDVTVDSQSPSFWARAVNWLSQFDEAVNYDSTQYALDRMSGLQREIIALTSRVKLLEEESNSLSRDTGIQAVV